MGPQACRRLGQEENPMSEAAVALEQIWSPAGGDPGALERTTLTGADPLLPTDFKIGTAASAVIGAGALAAAELWRLRTGRGQSVSVDARAAVAAFRSERYLRVDGQVPPDPRGEIFGFYRAGDGRWIQLHGAMPHHRDGITSRSEEHTSELQSRENLVCRL